MRFNGLLFAALLGLFLLPGLASAKTLYVEMYGTDAGNTTCAKASPCATIQAAIDNAGGNDRIIVGPGSYPGNLRIVTPGIRLTSVAGAANTIIEIFNSNPHGCSGGNRGICIEETAEKTTIGQKRKGFTIEGDVSGPFIEVLAPRAKIEGNDIVDSGTVSGSSGILFVNYSGLMDRTTIRYNSIMGVEDIGIYGPNDTIDDLRSNISDNVIMNTTSCIELYEEGNSRTVIRNNYLNGCASSGIYIDGAFGFPEVTTRTKIHGNIVKNAQKGIYGAEGGNPDIKGNAISKTTIAAIEISSQYGAKLSNNAVTDAVVGLLVRTSQNTTFSANTLAYVQYPIWVEDATVTFKKIDKNNFSGLSCPIVLDISSMNTPLQFSKNFWGDLINPVPLLGCNTNASTALGNGDIVLNPSSKPNPVKYKQKI